MHRFRFTRAGVLLGALALAGALSRSAHAQINPIVFDGNIVWNSGAGGTTYYAGAAALGSACLAGLDSSAVSIATSQFVNNSAVDPLLSGALNVATPNWRPAAGSPAFCGNVGHGKVLRVPNDGFFQQADFVGALGAEDQDWTQGWTYYGLDGGGRTFPVRPLVVVANQNLYSNRTFSADSNYLVRGQLRVKDQATLTVQPGTVIFEETATIGTIIIERGAKIIADGRPWAPIVLTSDRAPGQQVPGGTGGIFIHGRARTNSVNSCAGDSAASEGGAVGFYGGNDDADNSGVLRYVRSEFGGVVVAANNEANGLTLNGVGSGTVIDFIQSHRSSDDLLEFFGGTAQVKHAVLTYGLDDGFDWQMGYRGKAQFVVIRQIVETGADRGIEADNNEFANATELCSGRSNPTLSNFTILGDLTAGSGVTAAVHLRRGTGGSITNSIFANWKTAALEINGAETFANHCADRAGVVAPPIACGLTAANPPNPVVFDGNIVWNSGAGGTTYYNGAAAAGSACRPGLDSTTVQIATLQYANNTAVDPQLAPGAATAPNWAPARGGPAYGGGPVHGRTVNTPKDGFFDKTCFVGAVSADDDWTQGWTYYGLDGSGRTLPVRPLAVYSNIGLYQSQTWSPDSNYLVRGQLRVKDQATLTVPAGCVIFEETATVGTIIVERGGKIVANGRPDAVIILTSDRAPGQQVPGGTGGIFIHGRAKTNAVNSCAGDSAASEGGAVGFYGGNDDADSSGVLRYVRSEFGGVVVAANNEANGLTLNGVGSRTVIEYIQSTRSSDDLLEFFGGTAQVKHAVLTYGADDGFDWQMGYRGKAQFIAIRQLASETGADRGIEADNNEFANATELCSGRSNPTLSNVTLIGDRSAGPGVTAGAHLRRGTGGTIVNSLFQDWKTFAFELNGAETFANHCNDRAFAYGPGIDCSNQTTDAPIGTGRVFVASGFPNPARTSFSIRFALPRERRVDVDVFAADGRLVKSLGGRSFAAGEHVVNWQLDEPMPAGMYFYRVTAGNQSASGKFIRVDR